MTERVNIRRLQSADQERRLPLDPERDVSPEQWDTMRKDIERSWNMNDWESFTAKSAYLKLLKPDEARELTPDDWKQLYELSLEDSAKPWDSEHQTYFETIHRAANARLLDPAMIMPLNPNHVVIARNLATHFTADLVDNLRDAVAIALADPSQPPLQFSASEKDSMRAQLNKFRGQANWEQFTSLAADMRTLGVDVRILSGDWSKMRQAAEEIWKECETQQLRYTDYMGMLVSMKILEAKEVHLSATSGLEITMPEHRDSVTSKPTPMPETPNLPQ